MVIDFTFVSDNKPVFIGRYTFWLGQVMNEEKNCVPMINDFCLVSDNKPVLFIKKCLNRSANKL